MFWRGVWRVARREVSAISRDRLYISVVVLLPIAMMAFFAIIFRSGVIENLPIAVVDEDRSIMSQRLVRMLDSTRGVDVTYSAMSIDEAERLMLGGDVSAIVYIASGFSRGLNNGEGGVVECYIPGTSLSAAGIVEQSVQGCVRALSESLSVDKLQTLQVGYKEAVADISPINLVVRITANPYLNYGYYLSPVFMFMGVVIFTVISTIFAIGRELRYATVPEWLDLASGSLLGATIGKLLPLTVAMTLMMQLVFAILFAMMGMECAGSYWVLSLLSVLFIVAYQSVALFIIVMCANLRLGLSLGGGFAVMAFTFSGITFPVMAMYGVARLLSHIFPLTHFTQIFINIAMRGCDFIYLQERVLSLILFMILPIVVWPRYRSICSNVKYWGRD